MASPLLSSPEHADDINGIYHTRQLEESHKMILNTCGSEASSLLAPRSREAAAHFALKPSHRLQRALTQLRDERIRSLSVASAQDKAPELARLNAVVVPKSGLWLTTIPLHPPLCIPNDALHAYALGFIRLSTHY